MLTHRRAIVLLACALLLSACAGAGEDTAETQQPTAAATATVSATETDTTATGMDDEALTRVTEAAAATADEGTVRFQVTVSTEGTPGEDGTQPLEAEGEEDFEAEQRRLTFSGPGGELEMIVDGTDVYVEVPATEDATWARLELEGLVAGEVGFGGPAGLPFRSPRDNLAVLEDAVIAASEGVEEDVDGESATRYDLTVDLDQAAEQAAESGDTWSALSEQSGVTEMDMQVWIDAQERIRRIAYSLDLAQAEVDAATEGAEVEADPQGMVTVTVDYFDFGTPVDIAVPSDEDIVDVDEQEIRDSMQGAGEVSS